MKKTMMAFITMVIFSLCFSFIPPSFSQEMMPAPGTVIDKSNYKKYAHLFPPEFLTAFEDGFGGLIEPASITVSEPKPKRDVPEAFLAMSAANKGKFSLDANGNIVGGWKRQGMPFPDLQRSDKDFATKLMWNFAGRYMGDDKDFTSNVSFMQRRGESVRMSEVHLNWLFFANRIAVPPTPIMTNHLNVASLGFFHYQQPVSVRNMMTLAIRYMDLNSADEVYIYLPSLRRVLRGDTGQRSVPLQGNLASLDDVNCFDGKTDEFTYELVGEQKVLAIRDYKGDSYPKTLPKIAFMPGPYAVEDVYVIDIFAKDPKYPQSKKRVYLDKYFLMGYYAVIWDRAGKLWKLWSGAFEEVPIAGDRPWMCERIGLGIDVQFGMINLIDFIGKKNQGGVSWEDFSPASMVKKAK